MLAKKVRTIENGVSKYRNNVSAEVRISLNEMPFPVYITDLMGVEERLSTLELNRYPTVDDVLKVEELAANYLDCPVDRVCLGNGLDDLLFRMMLVFRGKRLGIVEPGFPCYETYAKRAGVDVCKAELSADFQLSADTVQTLIDGRPDFIILAYPNNPTGNCFDPAMIEVLLEQLPDTVVVIDEAYYDFSGQTLIDLLEYYPERVACTRTMSKGRGLAGVRIGLLAGPAWLVKEIKALELPFHFNNFMLLIAESALTTPDLFMVDEVIEEREFIFEHLRDHRFCRLYPSQSNFFWCQELGPEGWMQERFTQYGIRVKTYPEWPRFYRFSVGTSEENDRLLAALTTIKGV